MMSVVSRNTNRLLKYVPMVIAILLTMVVVVRNSWICDDAYVTLRSIFNFKLGFGLRYNAIERVQTYTHPLWLMVLALFYYIDPFIHFFVTLPALICTLFSLLIIVRISRSARSGLLALLLLIVSRSFITYSTSGLENSLSHLLLCAYAIALTAPLPNPFVVTFIASLAAMTRLDLVVLFLPGVFFCSGSFRQKIRPCLFGAAPLILWLAFCFLYYGFVFPNTAYAKLNTGQSLSDALTRGCRYYLSSVRIDPSLILMYPIIGLALWRIPEDKRVLGSLVAGFVMYSVYILWIGGDYMAGRFFSVLVVLSAIVVARLNVSRITSGLVSLAAISLPFRAHYQPFLVDSNFASDNGQNSPNDAYGVADEQRHYYRGSSLLTTFTWRDLLHPPSLPSFPEQDEKLRFQTVGQGQYRINPRIQVVDTNALVAPLLARLPVRDDISHRPGHFMRSIPPGYLATLETGENRLLHPEIAALYDNILLVSRGPIWSPQKLKASVLFLFRGPGYALDSSRWKKVGAMFATISEEQLAQGGTDFLGDGLRVNLSQESHAEDVTLQFRQIPYKDMPLRGELTVRVLKGSEKVFTSELGQPLFDQAMSLRIPAQVQTEGYDAIEISSRCAHCVFWLQPLSKH